MTKSVCRLSPLSVRRSCCTTSVWTTLDHCDELVFWRLQLIENNYRQFYFINFKTFTAKTIWSDRMRKFNCHREHLCLRVIRIFKLFFIRYSVWIAVETHKIVGCVKKIFFFLLLRVIIDDNFFVSVQLNYTQGWN